MRVRDARALGALIRDRRKAVGWSQTELAERIGASRSWVSETENGKDSAEIGLVLRALHALGLGVNVRDAYGVASPRGCYVQQPTRGPNAPSASANPAGAGRANNPPAHSPNAPSRTASPNDRPPLTRGGRPLSHPRSQQA